MDTRAAAGLDLLDALLDAVDHVEGVLAVAHDDDARDRLALRRVRHPAEVRPEDDLADIPHPIGVPLSLAETRCSRSRRSSGVAAARTMYSVPPNSISRAASMFPPRTASTTRWIDSRSCGLVGIDVHLVLPAVAADRRDSATPHRFR